MTDPIADTLTRLCNASSVHHGPVNMPYSKMEAAIANILRTEGYIKDYRVEEVWVGKTLVLSLKYGTKRERAISGVKRISKPGLWVYAKSNKLSKAMGGLGMTIISSSSGLLTDHEAVNRGVGEKVIAYIW